MKKKRQEIEGDGLCALLWSILAFGSWSFRELERERLLPPPSAMLRVSSSISCSLLLLLFLVVKSVLADVEVIGPSKDTIFKASSGASSVSIEVKWIDNNAIPAMDDITYYTFSLMTGPNNDIQSVLTLAKEVTYDDITLENDVYSYKVSVDTSVVGNGQYYIQVFAFVKGAGDTIHYSPRFYLRSMNGATSYTYTDSTQPVAQTSIVTHAATINSASFSIPYPKQTGISRFAPMQTPPHTKVTATTWSRRFPTSAVTYFSTNSKKPVQITTITPGWSGSVTSDVNYATPAPMPSDNGSWYNPKQKQTLSVRKLNLSKL